MKSLRVTRPSRQAAFFGPTVANGALRTWLDLQFAPPSRELIHIRHSMSAPQWTFVARLTCRRAKDMEIREAKICDRCHSLKQQLLLPSLWNW